MNEMQPTPRPDEYLCPGKRRPISRAVHLGRLAAFYPACRECPHREDTGSLSPRQVEQLNETAAQRRPRPLFHEEGAGGAYLSDLTPADARRIAAAFGIMAGFEVDGRKGEGRRGKGVGAEVGGPAASAAGARIGGPAASAAGAIVLAGDGRPIAAELAAAVAEGLRWSGCDVVDIGPATAPCLAFAVHHLQAKGGVSIGNPGMTPHEVGLQFWIAGPRPLSAGGGLETLAQLAGSELDRPTRRYGRMRRFQAEVPYLAALAEHYHALRPLRIAADSASKPLLDYLQKLCSGTACKIIPIPPLAAVHFAVQIDGDGETCRVFDEQGREVPPARLLQLLAVEYGRVGQAKRSPTMIESVGESVAGGTALRLSHPTMNTMPSQPAPSRAAVSAAMRASGAAIGFGPGCRYWHNTAGVPLPDALMTVTCLLKILSRGDEPLSAVLDRDAPVV